MIRKLLSILNAVALATIIAGCGETGKENDPKITPEIKLPQSIVSSGISVESEGQSVTVDFTTNVPWSASVSEDWVSISPTSGLAGENSVRVKVEANTDKRPRSATLTFSDKVTNQKVSVSIQQEAMKASLSITPESLAFSAGEEGNLLNVTSNTDWTITKDAEWITLDTDKGKGTATVTVGSTENTSLTSRTGTITVSTLDDSVKKTVSVQQAGADVVFSIDGTEFSQTPEGGTFTVKVTHNIGYKINSKPDWVRQTNKMTYGDTDTYTFSADANTSTTAREGVIVFCNDKEESVPVTVRQAGAKASLTVSPTALTFTAKGESKIISVTSNTAWTVSSDSDWLTLGATGGSGDAQVTATASENTVVTQRTATITVRTSDNNATATVKVTQSEADVIFTVDKTEVNVAVAGETFTVKVTRNIGYKINSMPDWVKQTNKATNDDADTYSFKADANTLTTAREGVIVFCNDKEECVPVNVKQAGGKATLSVSTSVLTFAAMGESKTFSVTSNTDWTATYDASWVKLNIIGGSGCAKITVAAEKNAVIKQRTATITLKTTDKKITATVNVIQNASDVLFSVDKNVVNVAAAKESFTVKVTHNIGYKINSKPAWVRQTNKVTNGNTDTYTFSADANTSTAAREGVIVFCNDKEERAPVTVKQAGAKASLTVSPEEMSFMSSAGNKTFKVTSNTAWSVTSDAAWVKTSAASGSGNASMTASAEENTSIIQRTAIITIKTTDGEATAMIKVTQSAAKVIFSVNSDRFSVAAEGDYFTVKVTRNIGYKINSMPGWVKQTNKVNNGNVDIFTFKVEANLSTTPREEVIVFRNDKEENVTVTVKQSGASEILSVSPTEMSFTAKGGSKTMSITSNTAWIVSSNKDWVKLGVIKGSGDTQVTVSIEENKTHTKRSASISLKTNSSRRSTSITVLQDASD